MNMFYLLFLTNIVMLSFHFKHLVNTRKKENLKCKMLALVRTIGLHAVKVLVTLKCQVLKKQVHL